MPDRRSEFCENIANVKEKAARDAKRLVQDLKRMAPTDFLRLPPQTFASLTAAQYREVVATISPDTTPPPAPTVEEVFGDARRRRDWWRARSTFTQMAIVTFSVTTILLSVAVASPWAWRWAVSHIEIVRPLSTATWPRCARLSFYTDGCVYYPTRDLQWAAVAAQLQIPRQELYDANKHLPPQFIPANAPLAIWRHRGRLEQ